MLGFIPCRSNSKGLPKKGLIKFGDKSLIQLSVETALDSQKINKVVFSSDSTLLINKARKAGAEVPFVRPLNLSTDVASTWDVVRHCLSFLAEKENYTPDIIVLLQPTTPFRTKEIIDKCIDNLVINKLNACITVTDVTYPPQWTYSINNQNYLSKYIGNKKWPLRRQDADRVYQPNGMVYVIKVRCLKKKIPLPTSKMGYVYVNKDISINLDEPIDFKLAQLTWSELNDKDK